MAYPPNGLSWQTQMLLVAIFSGGPQGKWSTGICMNETNWVENGKMPIKKLVNWRSTRVYIVREMANGAFLILTYAVTLTLALRPCDSETLLVSESSVSEWRNTKNKTLNCSTKLGIHSSTKTMFLYILLQTSAVKSYNGGSTKPGIVEDWSRKGLQGHTLVSCVLLHSMCDPPCSIYHTSSNLHATKPTTFVFHTTFFFKIFPIYFVCYSQAVCNSPLLPHGCVWK